MSDAAPTSASPPSAFPPAASPPPPPVTAPQPPRSGRPWLTVLLCVLIFVAGGVTGAGAMALHTARRVLEAVRHPEVIPDRIVSRLRRPLDLDEQQELQIKAILARHQATILEARAEAMRQVRPEFEGIEADIAAILRPEQVERWHDLYKRFLREWMPEGLDGAGGGRGELPRLPRRAR